MTDTALNPGEGPEQARTLERTANVKTQVVAIDIGGAAGPEKLVDQDNPVPVADAAAVGALANINAQAATIADLQNRLIELNETMTYFLGAMLEKMPRLDAGDRLMARVVLNGENDLNSAYGGVALNSVGNPSTGAQFMRTFEPWNFSDAGAARIYQQIQVTA
jgi:hypothetical protein